MLGKTGDATTYATLATNLAAEYNTKYLHTDNAGNAWYANDTEASNAVALDAGLVPAQYHQAVVNSLVAAVAAYGDRIGTGSVALGPLFRALHAAGQDDLLYRMVTNQTGPSYASIVDQGTTTLWENLTGSGGSQDHQFLVDVAAWLVTHAAGGYVTPQGRVAVSWVRAQNGRVALHVTVPANTTAEIWVPQHAVYHVGPGTYEFDFAAQSM